jgi:hypothetical protein
MKSDVGVTAGAKNECRVFYRVPDLVFPTLSTSVEGEGEKVGDMLADFSPTRKESSAYFGMISNIPADALAEQKNYY